ncbi:DNA polymerase IV [Wenjunlia vitaminophila]|uniref:DNA polymerase IV n=1 Tax=Wenjunlia vitaminophila TaxID=76728 RepID=UPI0005950DDD|nr:DNA polymerase IV [Wenjunlia vitaminophila]
MRAVPTILHLDMDAFYASVEQAAKPSLRGKAVIVGGLGPRGVVATASYEARRSGVHSAMAMGMARRLCPNAAFLVPRFPVYRQVSEVVMAVLRSVSPLVEPLSLDEAFVDLEAGPHGALLDLQGQEPTALATARVTAMVLALAEDLRADIGRATGLTASVGVASSKMLAKIASEQAKPDGLLLVEPGREHQVLDPLPVRALPGVGPATAEHLRRAGIATVAEAAAAGKAELVRLLGKAQGAAVASMAAGRDDRPVVADRETKSVSVEDTFEVDLADRTRVLREIDRLAESCVRRLRAAGKSGRTVVVKVRRFDFSTLTRSETLRAPTDDPAVVLEIARRLMDAVDTTGGVRLLGVGVTGLADFTQEDLFAHVVEAKGDAERPGGPVAGAPGPEGQGAVAGAPPGEERDAAGAAGESSLAREPAAAEAQRRWLPGQDVRHVEFGPGWVQGSGVGRVTVRFETPWSPPGRVRTFLVDDPALEQGPPLPLTGPDGPDPEPHGGGPGPRSGAVSGT